MALDPYTQEQLLMDKWATKKFYVARIKELKKKLKQPKSKKQRVLEKTGGLCFYCEKRLTLETMTSDHYIAKSRGGKNLIDNLVPACKPCNSEKSSMDAEEFIKRKFGKGMKVWVRKELST